MVTVEQAAAWRDVADLREEYIRALAGPVEPFLEELISYSHRYYRLVRDGQALGYCCLSRKGTLLQFHLSQPHLSLAQAIFRQLLSQGLFQQALVSTRDHLGISVCMEFQQTVTVDDYLFADGPQPPAVASRWQGADFRVACEQDIPLIRAVCGDFHDFLHYTLEGTIADQGIFLLQDGGTLLGTGAIGSRGFQPPYVDIGMCVGESHRRQGVGTEIISRLRRYCHQQGWIPLASCRADNLASKRTLERAGLISRDRVLRCSF